jgi:hypothetical protein
LAYARCLGTGYTISGFREGVRLWHPPEDLAALIAYRGAKEWSLRSWLVSLLHRQHFPLFSFRDPLPSLLNWAGLPARLRAWSVARSRALADSDTHHSKP